ncbi:pimeloyl-ACP methyl ester carboxylesterase [Bradyrhizobium sp. F1.13.3]
MPHALTKDNCRLYFEEAGAGTPIIFLHEFAADYTNWEPQMRYFSRGHRCITYSARGYTPSDVPDGEVYGYTHFYTDALAVLDHLKIDRAHFVGLSMGAYSSLQIGLNAPQRALSMTLAGVGSARRSRTSTPGASSAAPTRSNSRCSAQPKSQKSRARRRAGFPSW